MKKTLSIILAIVLAMSAVLSLTACGKKGVPEGKYKLTEATSESGKMLIGYATLIVDSDGKASIKIVTGDLSSTSEVTFDESNGTAKMDDATAKYTVDGDKITFDFGNGNTEVYEKVSEEDEKKKSQAVLDVEALINKIGTVTNQSGDAIITADEKYKALSSDEKAQVSNYDVLKKANAAYEDILKKFVIGRWERRYAAKVGTRDFSEGDNLVSTMVIFDGYLRNKITNDSAHDEIISDLSYSWIIEDGLFKQKSSSSDDEALFTYKVDIKNKTMTEVEASDIVYNKESDDPDYYLN